MIQLSSGRMIQLISLDQWYHGANHLSTGYPTEDTNARDIELILAKERKRQFLST